MAKIQISCSIDSKIVDELNKIMEKKQWGLSKVVSDELIKSLGIKIK